jgi:hypothetical protein
VCPSYPSSSSNKLPSSTELESIFGDHAHPHEIGDAGGQEPKPLLETVSEFTEAALRGEFYEDFLVNSHNCTEKSGKTQVFEAQLDLLFDRCIEEAPTPKQVSSAGTCSLSNTRRRRSLLPIPPATALGSSPTTNFWDRGS